MRRCVLLAARPEIGLLMKNEGFRVSSLFRHVTSSEAF
ncbi:hypothetical protein SXCC_03331 [Gluconacetobacter sp. SXCC-1]|nr:hypothetical protein SXCC_03331 [Gluconacetobacter sp. SXCC-1]